VVASYAANTHQGMVRNYNEDRVSIILNIIQPKFKKLDFWPRCSFFAIYDGHGGAQCADFLRDQLH
jgi:serine/threonine protein phosphatase PrpC